MRRVVIAGVSTRAAAESAAQAGLVVTAIDAFGDLDQHASVRSVPLPRRFTAHAAARAARNIECDAVAYLSSFENHPSAVIALAAGRALWGNSPDVLGRVRDPVLVGEELRRRGIAVPEVNVGAVAARARPEPFDSPLILSVPKDEPLAQDRPVDSLILSLSKDEPLAQDRPVDSPLILSLSKDEPLAQDRPAEGRTFGRDRDWLVKPLASGGGHGVRPWPRGTRLPRGCYLQELVNGTPGSVAFVAAAGRAVPLGVSRQLVGEHAFGAAGYRYCGNILAAAGDAQFARDEALVAAACALAQAVAEELGVVGVNGIDFIARDGVPYAIEVNPRWSSSMELVERAYGLSVFGAHAAACEARTLPAFDLVSARRGAGAAGKAVVFARQDVTSGDTRAWLADSSVRDIPRPGARICAGRPVCTVFAAGRDAVACHAALVGRAWRVYAELAAWERGVA